MGVVVPTQTFHNLPSVKRDRLTVAVKTEFAQRDYRAASVDRITGAAGISKGSFYQYFRDKRDAYAFAVEDSLQARLAMTDALGPDATFTQRLTSIVRDTQSFRCADPLSWGVLLRRNDDDVLDIGFETDGLSYEWVREAIRDGITSGELRPDLDPDVATWFVEHTTMGLGRYLTTRLQALDAAGVGSGADEVQAETQRVVSAVLGMMLGCLTTGSGG